MQNIPNLHKQPEMTAKNSKETSNTFRTKGVQLNKMKAFYERKLEEKNNLLTKNEKETLILTEEKERILTEYKENSQQ